MATRRHSPLRFQLAEAESLRYRMEVRADTPDATGAARLLYVTDRRVVLCRLPVVLRRVTEVLVVLSLVIVALLWSATRELAVALALAVMVGIGIARSRLRRAAIVAERPLWSLSNLVWRNGAVGIGFADGRVWMLRPARVLNVMALASGRKALMGAYAALRGLLGHLDHPPLPLRPWRMP